MSNAHYAHAVGQVFKRAKDMPAVGKGKNPMVGFIMGFAFGPLGVGLYLGSFADFVLSLTMVLLGAFVTAGVGAPAFWALCGFWAYTRIRNSNAAELPRTNSSSDPTPPIP